MLDPAHLQTFLLVAEGNSFTETGRKLSLRQSTVSDHVRKLETHLGRQLFVRDTHSVTLTPYGEALIGYARMILEAGERAEQYFAGARARGRIRFGANEDLVLELLPDVLERFTRLHPEVDVELTVGLSSALIRSFDNDGLDLVLCKRWAGEERGTLLWRDALVWVGRHNLWRDDLRRGEAVPLVVYRPPSLTRTIALDALAKSAVGWRLACTCDNLSGLIAATRAGTGIMVLARSLVPSTLAILPTGVLPDLGTLDYAILTRQSVLASAQAAELAAAIMSRVTGAMAPRPADVAGPFAPNAV